MIVAEVLYLSAHVVVRMQVVVIFVRFYCCWGLCGAIGFYGGTLVVVVMAVVRVAPLIKSNNLTVCLLGFCINFGSGSGANSGCDGSSLAPNYNHYHYHHHHLSHNRYNKLCHELHHKTNTKIWNSR